MIQNAPATQPNLYLIGFMGTGKSSVGKFASDKLGLKFLDSDQEIERQNGCTISQIFESQGEEKFRELEKKFILTGHPNSGCLVSCGGGLPVPEGMIERIKSKGIVFALWAKPDTIFERTKENTNRPLLQTENPMAEINSLLKKREKIYLLANQIISSEMRSTKQVADIVVRHYLNFCEEKNQKLT